MFGRSTNYRTMAESLEYLCRACLSEDCQDSMVSLVVVDDKIKVLFELSSLMLDQDDPLPRHICGSCYKKFCEWSFFRSVVLESDRQLRSSLKDIIPALNEVDEVNFLYLEHDDEDDELFSNEESAVECLDESNNSDSGVEVKPQIEELDVEIVEFPVKTENSESKISSDSINNEIKGQGTVNSGLKVELSDTVNQSPVVASTTLNEKVYNQKKNPAKKFVNPNQKFIKNNPGTVKPSRIVKNKQVQKNKKFAVQTVKKKIVTNKKGTFIQIVTKKIAPKSAKLLEKEQIKLQKKLYYDHNYFCKFCHKKIFNSKVTRKEHLQQHLGNLYQGNFSSECEDYDGSEHQDQGYTDPEYQEYGGPEYEEYEGDEYGDFEGCDSEYQGPQMPQQYQYNYNHQGGPPMFQYPHPQHWM